MATTPLSVGLPLIAAAADDTQRTPTQRKKPRCTRCGALMLGHKRGQCQSTPSRMPAPPSFEAPKDAQVDLSVQLQDLHIDVHNEDPDEDERRERENRRRSLISPVKKAATLTSLASVEKAALDSLGQPGMMSDRIVELDETATRANIKKWLENVPRPDSPGHARRKRLSRLSLVPSSVQVTFEAPSDEPAVRRRSLAKAARPLGRTSSAVEREAFFDTLAEKSKKHVASVFTVEMSDVRELEENAKRLKFHARVIAPKFKDGTTGDGWLVIGKESDSVEEVFKEVEKDVKGGSGFVSAALGSGAVGAIAAWMYLAFS